MINPISQISNQGYYNLKLSSVIQRQQYRSEGINLSGYQAGKAILARNNICFKNIPAPVEITAVYNKKTDTKNSIDTKNLHVYKYPDTNLKLIIHTDKNVNTNDSVFLEQPQIIMSFRNNLSQEERNQKAELILKEILEQELSQKSEYVICNLGNRKNADFSFSEIFGENTIDNLGNLNETVDSLDINDNNLKNAVKKLNLEKENISVDYLKQYYNNLLSKAFVTAYVTVSEDYFKKNQARLFKNINSKMRIAKDSNEPDIKGMITDEIARSVLNAKVRFNRKYILRREHSDTSLIIVCKQKFNKQDFDSEIDNVINNDLHNVFGLAKKAYLQDVKESFEDPKGLALMKNSIIAKYDSNIFNLDEIVNNISEKEVKDCMENIKNQEYKLKIYEDTKNESV